jgi:hypothetical protein
MHSAPLFAVSRRKMKAAGAFLIGSLLLFAWLVLGTGGTWFVRNPGANTLLTVLFGTVALGAPAVVAWHLRKAWRTVVSEIGVLQPTLSGPVAILWSEVTRTRLTANQALDLYAEGKLARIPAGLFESPEKVIAYVLRKVQDEGRI